MVKNEAMMIEKLDSEDEIIDICTTPFRRLRTEHVTFYRKRKHFKKQTCFDKTLQR